MTSSNRPSQPPNSGPGSERTVRDDRSKTVPGSQRPPAAAEDKPRGPGADDLTDLDPSSLLAQRVGRSFDQVGPYEVSGELGHGAMGIVLKAFDSVLHRTVAIKVLAPQLAACERFRHRFLKEARAAAQVNHPNVVTIHTVDEHDGLPFLVMEFISGRTLKQRIQATGSLDVLEILRIGSQIAEGLEAAHRQGVVHRDIKPSNIMLEETSQRVKITDFGLARAAVDQSGQTSLGRIVGTPAYMSPEQIAGGRIDARSDLFSFGCVLYAMATGSSPFRGTHTVEILHKVGQLVPPPLHELEASQPPALSKVVGRLLEKHPDDRYQSAAEAAAVLHDLEATCHRSPFASTVRGVGPGRLPTSRAEKARPKAGRRWLRYPIALAVAASVALAFAPLWMPLVEPDGSANAPSRASEISGTPDAQVMRVAQSGDAQHRSLTEALQHAGPGSEIHVLDNATYDGAVEIDNRDRWRGVKIISTQRATITARGSSGIISISRTPGVVIEGFNVRTEPEQHAVVIGGAVPGVVLRNLRVTAPEGGNWALVHLRDGATGSVDAPIEILDSTWEVAGLGIIVEGGSGMPVSFIRIRGNQFLQESDGTKIQLLHAVHNVEVTGNVFVGGKGISCMLSDHATSSDVLIGNNSFLDARCWLNLASSRPDHKNVRICNNLILGGGTLDAPAAPLAEFAHRWEFAGNQWEAAAEQMDPSEVKLIARPVERVDLLSRDPTDPDFLRPPPDSPLGRGGVGGDLPEYVGAFPPVNHDFADKANPP